MQIPYSLGLSCFCPFDNFSKGLWFWLHILIDSIKEYAKVIFVIRSENLQRMMGTYNINTCTHCS